MVGGTPLLLVCHATNPQRQKVQGGYVGGPLQPQRSCTMPQIPWQVGLGTRMPRHMLFPGAECLKGEDLQ